jgi:hypothetical protein
VKESVLSMRRVKILTVVSVEVGYIYASTSYKILFNILLSMQIPYADKIIACK